MTGIVSILTSPLRLVLQIAGPSSQVTEVVSILTSPLRLVLRVNTWAKRAGCFCFNPHQPVKAGASRAGVEKMGEWRWFQSSPAR